MKKTPAHLPFLDHFRGVAVLWVFLFHAVGAAWWDRAGFDQLPWVGWWRDFHQPASALVLIPFMWGWVGVAIFFVVSGFCIQLSHQRSGERGYGTFYTRRFFRIYPPYLLAVLIYALLVPGFSLPFDAADRFISLGDLGTHLALVHNFINRYAYGIAAPLWSVAVEVQLYLLYPLLLALVGRLGWTRTLWLAPSLSSRCAATRARCRPCTRPRCCRGVYALPALLLV
ncbi:MAG: acyltransferase [Verrucomicrobiota bacterium]